MQLIPAIDIQNGACVRLLRGDFDTTTVYADDPAAPARRYAAMGAPLLHVVDLDGARAGKPVNTALLGNIGQLCPVQAGGGLRDEGAVATLLQSGAARAVVGSIAVTDPVGTGTLLRRFGAERIVLALDVRRRGETYIVCTHGWTVESAHPLDALLDLYCGLGLRHALITDIDRDGALSGANVALYAGVVEAFPGLAVQASGGIRNAADLAALAACGVAAAISGKALLERRIDEKELQPYLQSA